MDSFNTDRKMSGMTREEEIDYLEKVSLPVMINYQKS